LVTTCGTLIDPMKPLPPSLTPSNHRARALWLLFTGLAVPGLFLIAAPFSGGGCNDDPHEPRRGLAGDSCLTTNDCVAPLSCVGNVCGGATDGGVTTGSGGGGGSPPVDAGITSKCDFCLDKACTTELAACDGECIAIEACIETQCRHLGEIGSADEGSCFVNCQSNHSAGKSKHLDVVNCSITADCLPPCVPYPQDYDACRAFMDKALCAGPKAACDASLDCKNFNDCVSLCSTASECIACDDTPEGQAGRKLRESYETCVATECISESWLPQTL
jgi:hypothetical protein